MSEWLNLDYFEFMDFLNECTEDLLMNGVIIKIIDTDDDDQERLITGHSAPFSTDN